MSDTVDLKPMPGSGAVNELLVGAELRASVRDMQAKGRSGFDDEDSHNPSNAGDCAAFK